MSARLSQFLVYGGRVFVCTIYIYEVLDSIPLWDIVTQRERLWQRVSLSVIECRSCHRNSLWRGVMGEWLWWMQGQFNCLSSNVLNRKLIIWSLTSEKVDAAILDCKRQELLTKLNTSWFHNWIEKGKNYHMSNCHLIVITWFQCVKKLLWVPMGSQIRHLWTRWVDIDVRKSNHAKTNSKVVWGLL